MHLFVVCIASSSYCALQCEGDIRDVVINRNKSQKKKSLHQHNNLPIWFSHLTSNWSSQRLLNRHVSRLNPKTMPSFCSTVLQVFRQLEIFLELYPQDRHSLLCKQRRQDIQQKQHPQHSNPSYAFKEKDLWKFIEKEQSFFSQIACGKWKNMHQCSGLPQVLLQSQG